MTVSITIEPRVSPNAPDFISAAELSLRDLDFTNSSEQGLAVLRRRVDRNDWDYGVAVVDNFKIPLLGLERFGGLGFPTSIFRMSGRDGARVVVSYKGILLYTGFCTETGSTNDFLEDRTAIQSLAPEVVLRSTLLDGADIADGNNLLQSLEGCFRPQLITDTFTDITITIPSPDDVVVDVDNSTALNDLSAFDTLTQILLAADLVAIFEPSLSVRILPRGRRTERGILSIDRGQVLALSGSEGRNRLFTRLVTPTSPEDDTLIAAERPLASAQYGIRELDVNLDWVASSAKKDVLEFLLDRLVKPAREFKIAVPFDVMEQLNQTILPMDPVDLAIEADAPAFSAKFGTARFGSAQFARRTTRDIFAETYVIDARMNFETQTIDLTLREDVNQPVI